MNDIVGNFCQRVSFDIVKRDGSALSKQLTISNNTLFHQASIPRGSSKSTEPQPLLPDEESLALFDEYWAVVIENYFKLMNNIRSKNKIEAFNSGNDLLKSMNRCAERENDWILAPLKTAVKDLKTLAILADLEKKPHDRSRGLEDDNIEKEKYIEQASRTINKSFTICLNDRDLDIIHSKKKAVYFFVSQLYHVYFKLNKYDLAKSVQRALNYKLSELPSLRAVPKSSAVSYLYYSGCLYANDGNLLKAEEQFSTALSLVAKKMIRHQQSILLMLVPIKLFMSNTFPATTLFDRFPKIKALYQRIFKAIKQGNLKKFNNEVKKIEKFLLKKNLYLVFQQLKQLVIVRLYKRTFLLAKQLPDLFPNVYQLPINALAKALDFALNHTSDIKKIEERHKEGIITMDADLAESFLANLIFQGHIKGYIAHGNGVVVLSKKDPFPKRSQA